MQWLEHDEVPIDELPAWAHEGGTLLDGDPYDVRMFPEGIALSRGRVASALRWEDVLVPIRLEDPHRLLIATARRPPRAPWFELGGADVTLIEGALRTRLEWVEGTYRERRRAQPVVPPNVVLTSVLDHAPLPGAVEIHVPAPSSVRVVALGAALGGAALGLLAPAIGIGAVATAFGVVGGAGVAGALELARARLPKRVLVLTPDAFVGGLDGRSVRAVSWARVGRFAEGVDDRGESALEVFGPADELLARVAARYFGKPLDVIVAIAESYRKRAVAELDSANV